MTARGRLVLLALLLLPLHGGELLRVRAETQDRIRHGSRSTLRRTLLLGQLWIGQILMSPEVRGGTGSTTSQTLALLVLNPVLLSGLRLETFVVAGSLRLRDL